MNVAAHEQPDRGRYRPDPASRELGGTRRGRGATRLRVGSLFSGIGGLDLGLHRAGHEHVFLCESDPWRRDVLKARFPGVPVYEDVRAVGANARGGHGRGDAGIRSSRDRAEAEVSERVDLLCGGFPCQDISVAGRRRGLAGERSSLFFEFARVADALRPRWVLVENVPGLLSSNGGRDFGIVLGALAELGYGLAWRVLDSRYFGVPQRRRRVFIVGALAHSDPAAAAGRAGQVLALGTRCPGHPPTRGETRPDDRFASLSGLGSGGPDDNDAQGGRLVANGLVGRYGKGTDSDATDTFVTHALTSEGADASEDGTGRGTPLVTHVVAPTLDKGAGDGPRRNQDAPIIYAQDPPAESGHGLVRLPGSYEKPGGGQIAAPLSVRRLTPTECERLQGLPDGWTQLGGTPDSRRYSALGDAVTATVAEWIGRRLVAA